MLPQYWLFPRSAIIGAMVLLALSCQAIAQTSQPSTAPAPGQSMTAEEAREYAKKFARQMHDAHAAHWQKALGASDEEWKVLLPKVEKLSALWREVGQIKGIPSTEPIDPSNPKSLTDFETSVTALRKLLDNKDAAAKDIEAALNECRRVRDAARQQLTKVQAKIKELLTTRQEALLFSMGLLE